MFSVKRVLISLAMLSMVAAMPAAMPAAVAAHGATVNRSQGCGFGADIIQISSPSGNNTVVCQGTGQPTQHIEVINPADDFLCASFGEYTSSTVIVHRPDGGTTLVCQFNPSGQ